MIKKIVSPRLITTKAWFLYEFLCVLFLSIQYKYKASKIPQIYFRAPNGDKGVIFLIIFMRIIFINSAQVYGLGNIKNIVSPRLITTKAWFFMNLYAYHFDQSSSSIRPHNYQKKSYLRSKSRHWHIGALTPWHHDSLAHWHIGTLARWHIDTLAHWHIDTLTHWHMGKAPFIGSWSHL